MQREPSPALALPLASAWHVLVSLVVVVLLAAPDHGVAADGARPPGAPAPVAPARAMTPAAAKPASSAPR